MNLLQSIILGIIQGLTEFLPVSSSGHLAIAKYIFGLADVGIFFDILLHVGTLAAVVAVYHKDIVKLVVSAVRIIGTCFKNLDIAVKKLGTRDPAEKAALKYLKVADTSYKKFVIRLVISSIPVGIAGFLLEGYIEEISRGLLIPGICLLITGVVLLIADAVEEGRKGIRDMSHPQAFLIGVAQAFAMFPGISRSGMTISATLVSGVKRESAVKYSFMLSIPVILGAALKSSLDVVTGEAEITGNVIYYLAGALVAAVVGYFAIRLLRLIIKNKKFKYFSFYCFIVGIVAIVAAFVK